MYFLKNKPDLVHFLKGSGKTFSNTFLAEIKRTYTKWCPFSHGKLTDHACYLIFQHEMGWIEYIRYFAFTVRFILGDSRDYQGLLNLIDKLADPDSNRTKEEFGLNLNKLTIYIKKIEEELKVKHSARTAWWKKHGPFYRDLSGDLVAVKNAWRNPTMHIEKRYDQDEATLILKSVEAFMRRMSTKLKS